MIKIDKKELEKAAQESNDAFLNLLTNAYLATLGGNLTSEKMALLNGNQHTLLAHRFFCDEIRDGGFVQLIQNGYGAYIFDNPFAKAMRQFGADELSKLLYKAKKIYDSHKAELERETTEEEFNAMYVEFEVFDDLEEIYFEIEEEQLDKITQYVKKHMDDFVTSI